ncbi:MAG TPA: gliding motility-associated C-terminal domain-containing protein [Segetibacter sp.]|nr:gliding motility-associated C-terminal domain-containing protein [Segetibacter sp.]
MKKVIFLFILLLGLFSKVKADHITGGEIYYTSSAGTNGTNTYNVTFKLFMRCNSGRQFNNPTVVSVFDKGTNQRVTDINVNLTSSETIQITSPDPCITDPPNVCYVVGYYNFVLNLPATANGYILSSQVNYRIQGISNFQSFYSNIGATYAAEIPGTPAAQNNSAQFTGNDLVVVCSNNKFSYSFGATDKDGDQLRYSFCEAYRSGIGGNNVTPPPPPPYQAVPYGSGFTESKPLGTNVKIDPQTGLITGLAPSTGTYVVTVCVEEIRNGVVIARQRKDLQINIAPCNIAAALLEPEYMLCKDTKTISLTNLSSSPLIRTSFWEITNRAGGVIFSSGKPSDTYTFADTGLYKIKLSINRGQACSDSTSSIARVYPGFIPDYNFTGICFNKPTSFKDLTTTVFGTVNSWNWNFGNGDTSNKQSPAYTYVAKGTMNVKLVVTNTLGCRDEITKSVAIVSEPPIKLAFKDTLICKGDTVTLKAAGGGNLTWSFNSNVIAANSPVSTVTPATTSLYIVNIDDNGCLNRDSVLVRVTDKVTLHVMNDTTICRGDAIQLRVESDAFTYSWSPSAQLSNSSVANPFAVTNNKTTYTVKANIGGCSSLGSITVSTVPYPLADAGKDTLLCYNTAAQLQGSTDASTVRWLPAVGLSNTDIINPVANPARTTTYILSAYDTKGCPKPGFDSVTVTVLPPIQPFAGHDTVAVLEQPLQLSASGGVNYLWSPGTGLSATNVANPIGLYNETFNQITYKVVVFNEANCRDSAFVTVKIFNTAPTVFVPTAFTPNGDGKNDVLKPVVVGMKQFDRFSVYNRWGQQIFTTQTSGKGWDGSINSTPQPAGTYVWWVSAIDYKGAPYFKKGTVTLIK